MQKGMEAITWTQKKILPVFAKCNMSSRKTAEEIFLNGEGNMFGLGELL